MVPLSPMGERLLRNPMAPGCHLPPKGGTAYSPAPSTTAAAPSPHFAPALPVAGAAAVLYIIAPGG